MMSNQLHGKQSQTHPTTVALDTVAFEQFEGWLELELDLLVNAWSHVAAPGAESKAERNYLQKTRHPK